MATPAQIRAAREAQKMAAAAGSPISFVEALRASQTTDVDGLRQQNINQLFAEIDALKKGLDEAARKLDEMRIAGLPGQGWNGIIYNEPDQPDAAASGSDLSVTTLNAGAGEGHILSDNTLAGVATITAKTLKAGTGIGITETDTEITFAPDVAEVATENDGSGAAVLKAVTTGGGVSTVPARRLNNSGSGLLVVTENANDISIADGIPAPPGSGTQFLSSVDGVLVWVDGTDDCPDDPP